MDLLLATGPGQLGFVSEGRLALSWSDDDDQDLCFIISQATLSLFTWGLGRGLREQKHCEAKAQNWHCMASTTFCGLKQVIWRG